MEKVIPVVPFILTPGVKIEVPLTYVYDNNAELTRLSAASRFVCDEYVTVPASKYAIIKKTATREGLMTSRAAVT